MKFECAIDKNLKEEGHVFAAANSSCVETMQIGDYVAIVTEKAKSSHYVFLSLDDAKAFATEVLKKIAKLENKSKDETTRSE